MGPDDDTGDDCTDERGMDRDPFDVPEVQLDLWLEVMGGRVPRQRDPCAENLSRLAGESDER